MVGLKTAIPIGIGVAFAGLFVAVAILLASGYVSTTATVTQPSTLTTTLNGIINEGSTTTVTIGSGGSSVATTTFTQTSTVTNTKTFTTTLAYVLQTPAIVTLVVSCSGCSPGFLSQYLYSGSVTNGTQRNQHTTSINSSGTGTYSFVGSQAELATQDWSVTWSVYATGNTGTLEVKVYFNSALISDKTAAASSGGLFGSVTLSAY